MKRLLIAAFIAAPVLLFAQVKRTNPPALASEVYLTLVAGRADEAAATSQRILSLDPLNQFSRVQPVWVSFFSRRHDDSIRFANTLREVWPNNIMAPFFLASNYAVKGRAAEVDVECGKVMTALSGAYLMQILGQCAWAYATVGLTQQAHRLAERLEHPPEEVWLDPVVMASLYGSLGEIDRAIQWCEKGLEERSPNMIYMKASPAWDALRQHPRFQAILRLMSFPP